MIPPLEASGLLPPGRHSATLDEVRATFVDAAPHSDHRALIFRALEVHAQLAWSLYPGARLWVDGGFVTYKADVPKDVDVVIVTPDDAPIVGADQLHPLLTLRDVTFREPQPGGQLRLQPMGGLVDGFITRGDDVAKMAFWDLLWSRTKGSAAIKGYLEVSA